MRSLPIAAVEGHGVRAAVGKDIEGCVDGLPRSIQERHVLIHPQVEDAGSPLFATEPLDRVRQLAARIVKSERRRRCERDMPVRNDGIVYERAAAKAFDLGGRTEVDHCSQPDVLRGASPVGLGHAVQPAGPIHATGPKDTAVGSGVPPQIAEVEDLLKCDMVIVLVHRRAPASTLVMRNARPMADRPHAPPVYTSEIPCPGDTGPGCNVAS